MPDRLPTLTSALALLVACGEAAAPEPPAQLPSWETTPVLQAEGWLLDVTASQAGDVWYAVGGTPDRGVVMRQSLADGTEPGEWQAMATPEVPLLNWLHPFDDGQLVAVGQAGTLLWWSPTDETWTLMESPTEEDLWGVWGSAPDDVWAVGGRGRAQGEATLLHFDGGVWASQPLPELTRPRVWALFKVWGSSADNVYAVGQRGAVLRFDGARWQEELVGTGEDLISLWGTGPDQIAIVGGRSNGVLSHWNGTRWNAHPLAPLPGMNGIWVDPGGVAHLAGIEGTLARFDLGSGQWFDDPQPTRLTFHAIHGRAGRLVTVGGSLSNIEGPFESIALQKVEMP